MEEKLTPEMINPGLDGSIRDYVLGSAFPRPAAPEGATWKTAPAPIAPEEISETLIFDVVIIGAGHAGVCAFRSAAESGATAALIERQPENVHKYMGMGHIGHINSSYQRKFGVPEIDVQEFVNDWQLRSNNRSNAGLVMKFAQNSGKSLEWVLELLSDGERESITVQEPSRAVAPMVNASGIKTWIGSANVGPVLATKALNKAVEKAKSLGGRTFYGVSAEQLIKDGNAVTGVLCVDTEGVWRRIMARKGVLLSAGDFSGNPEMCHDLATEITDNMGDDYYPSGAGCDGSGIRMGMWAGGKLEPRPLSTMGGAYYYPTDTLGDPLGNSGVLWLNKYGKRYCNEVFGDYVLASMPGMRQPRGVITQVFDSDILSYGRNFPQGHMSLDYDDERIQARVGKIMADAVAAGDAGVRSGSVTVFAADTYEQLADRLGYTGQSKDNFCASIRRYNELCHAGVDSDFGKQAQFLHALEKAPFFGYSGEIKPGPLLATTGGLLTDDEQNVLDRDCEPISGLYASGNCCGGRFGFQYTTPVSGISIGMAQTMGMLAGRTIAALPPRDIT
jgi:succinate dehydrogenase/fumarate reductase flavoprotein subunit